MATTQGREKGLRTFDIAVIGGGPAGAATAVVAAEAGRRVLLVEQRSDPPSSSRIEPPAYKIGEGLPGAGRMLLGRLGVWQDFLKQGHLPSYSNQSYWGSAERQVVDFIRDPHGHAWHLDRLAFDALLRHRAEQAGAELWTGTKFLTAAEKDGGWSLRLRRGEPRASSAGVDGEAEIETKILVDATGRVARVSAELGVPRRKDDELLGFHRLFQVEDGPEDGDSSTLIESVADGWWYTAPLPGKVRVVAFFTDADLEGRRLAGSGDGFQTLLGKSANVGSLLVERHYRPITEPRAAPSHSGCLETVVGPGRLAVGDAATAFDPLSSQGIYSALHSGVVAGEALDRHLSGDEQALALYQDRIATVYDTYLRNRNAYYQLEQRFVDRPFWRRRLG